MIHEQSPALPGNRPDDHSLTVPTIMVLLGNLPFGPLQAIEIHPSMHGRGSQDHLPEGEAPISSGQGDGQEGLYVEICEVVL